MDRSYVRSLLRSLFSSQPQADAFPPPVPDEPFYAIGDIHGRADLLQTLLSTIHAEEPDIRLVFVGDYVDRGPSSKEVLDILQALRRQTGPEPIFLMGNHERMCLDYIEDPGTGAERWLRHGGLQTVSSFTAAPAGGDTSALRDHFVRAMGPATLGFLKSLRFSWRSGNVAVVHAATDPALPYDMQPESTLLWGHPSFHRLTRADGLWVVHGHTIVEAATARMGRIAIDTGAYATGQLTAARIGPEGIAFLST